MDSAVPLAPSSQIWPATNGARKLAEALGVDLREVAPRVPRPGAFVDTQDVRRHTQPATCQPEVCAPGAEATTVRTQQPAVKKRRGKAIVQEGPSEAAGGAPAPESSPAEDVCGDPLLLDGNRVRVKWPMEDGTWAELDGAVQWLAERAAAGRKRVYEVAFDDGDVRWTRLVGKVAFTVTGSGYKAGRLWTRREDEAMSRRKRAKLAEGNASIGVSLGRSADALLYRSRMISCPEYAPQSGTTHAPTGMKVGWRRVVTKAMQGLPERQGTMSEIYAAVEKLPDVIGALDTAIHPGTKAGDAPEASEEEHRQCTDDPAIFRRSYVECSLLISDVGEGFLLLNPEVITDAGD
eukprot:gene16029-19011_t